MQKQQQKSSSSAIGYLLTICLVSLIIPGLALVFLATGPHSLQNTLFWILPFWLILFADLIKVSIEPNSKNRGSNTPFTVLVYLLALIQICNIWFMLEMASKLEWTTPLMIATSLTHLLAIKVIIGTSSSFSGIVAAHELIHKRPWHSKILGRLLLSLVCYEHFFTEHLNGHHCNVGHHSDPATARFGESFNDFWKRTVLGQFTHAWQLEVQRVGPNWYQFPKILRHRVIQGLLFEFALIVLIAYFFGLTALIAFLIQAFAAVRKLEAVNYIEHWGLERKTNTKQSKDIWSWETDSWLTLHALIGLSRHTDHHRHAGKPFQQLEYCSKSPQLPYGYFASIFLGIFANSHYQTLVTQQLRAKQLGPFQSTETDHTINLNENVSN